MDTAELDRLIISNLPDLDATTARITQLGEIVWRELGRYASEWAKNIGWRVDADEDNVKLAHPEWPEDVYCYFAWGPGDDESGKPGEASSWLARIAGVSGGQLCLWFEQRAGARAWRPIAAAGQATASGTGFRLSDSGHFYAPCTLDRSTLAEAVADDKIVDAFRPIDAALAAAAATAPLFTQLIAKANQT